MRFATTVDVEETATGSTVGPAEVAWQMTAHEVRALGGLGWGGSLVLRSKSKGLTRNAPAAVPDAVEHSGLGRALTRAEGLRLRPVVSLSPRDNVRGPLVPSPRP